MRGDITSKIVEMAIATFAHMPNRYEDMQDQDGKEEKAYTAVERLDRPPPSARRQIRRCPHLS